MLTPHSSVVIAAVRMTSAGDKVDIVFSLTLRLQCALTISQQRVHAYCVRQARTIFCKWQVQCWAFFS